MAKSNGAKIPETNGNFRRTPATQITELPGALPKVTIGSDTDAATIANDFIPRLSTLGIESLTSDAVWRDSLALTGTFRTFNTATKLLKAWKATSETHVPVGFTMKPKTAKIV